MSPQNGHIRCAAKSPSRASIFSDFRREAPMKARNLRRLARNGCGAKAMVEIRVNILFDNHDTSWSTILCKIALFARKCGLPQEPRSDRSTLARWEGEQFRSAILVGPGHHDARDEHLLSLFQIL